jgi:hypothetical protein
MEDFMGADYSKMTDQDFEDALMDAINDYCLRPSDILGVTGVYEILSERFNNEALEIWAAENPELAYPEEEKEDES